MAFVIQRAARQYQFLRNATVRAVSPNFIFQQMLAYYTREMERAISLNPDPAGTRILQGQLGNVVPISIGATQLIMTSIVGMRSSVISAYALPVGTEQIESWMRQNVPKSTLPMDCAEYCAFYAADFFRPYANSSTVTSFEVLTCLSDPAIVNAAAATAHMANILGFGLPAGAPPRTWQSCMAAYSNYATFKQSTMRLATVAMPTGGTQSGWAFVLPQVRGTAIRLFAGFDTSILSMTEFAKVVYFRDMIVAEGFVGLDANAEASPFDGWATPTTPALAAWIVGTASDVLSENSLLYLIRGPTLT